MADANISNYYNNRYNKYIGARYIPIFDGEWSNTKTYEPLTIVTNEGNSYISKTNVPTGIEINNETYWVLFSNYNAQIQQLINKIEQAQSDITENSNDINVLENTVSNLPMVPTDLERTNYKNWVLQCLASYLAQNSFSSCIVGTPTKTGAPIVYIYKNLSGYLGLYGSGTFDYSETTPVDSTNYKNFYADCTTFTSLITKGILYAESPYYLAFNGSPTQQELYDAGQENPELNKPFTFDCFNNFNPDENAYVMAKSGCTLKTLSNHNAGSNLIINQNVANELETGDLIYLGNSAHYDNNEYNGIYHCGIYVKTIEELNTFGQPYGITFKSILDSDDNTSYGYVVDMNNATGATNYTDALAIRTLYHHMNHALDENQWINTFSCRPISNFMNSNKARLQCTGQKELINNVVMGTILDKRKAFDFDMLYGILTLYGIEILGVNLTEGEDLNNLHNGCWRCDNLTVANSILNKPSTSSGQFFDVIGFGFNGNLTGTQIYIEVGTSRMFYRTTSGVGTWSGWKQITQTDVS